MAQHGKAPDTVRTGAGARTSLARSQRAEATLTGFQAQVIAGRYGLAIETAGMIALLALGGVHG